MKRVCNKKLVIRDKKKYQRKYAYLKYIEISRRKREIEDCVRNEKVWLDDRLDY